ncbi:efflux RND transporter permease subunit [[Eubacterium] cellulosolvens]
MASSVTEKLANFISKYFGVVIGVILILTFVFIVIYGTFEANTSEEAMNSDTEIHQAWNRYEDNFRPSVHGLPFVVEAKDGNVLNMEEFREIAEALNKVTNDKIVQPMLLEFYDDSLFVNKTSINSIPDAVQLIMDGDSPLGYQIGYHNPLNMGNNFTNANDDDLNRVLDKLFQYTDVSGTYVYKEIISAELKQENGRWVAPVMMIFIGVDNNLLEKNYTYDYYEKDHKKYYEKFDLDVTKILEDNIKTCDVYGVGIGVNDEIENEINESGPFMMFVFIIIVIILAVSFKHNFKSFLAASIGLLIIIFWMLGTARLLNLSETQFTAFLPILIMALGIDYAIHSMKRFDEELIDGNTPRQGVRNTILKLSGTLALAMLTTFVAFFSNVFSSIPALKDWGLEAGLAIIWTFIIMGLFVPSLRLAFERKANRDIPYYTKPNLVKNKGGNRSSNPGKTKSRAIPKNRIGSGLSKLTFGSVSHPSAIIIIIILLVIPLGYGAINLGTDFELEEFFDPESDLVVGLDLYTEHFPTGGEPNLLLIEGDIAEPAVVEAIGTSRERFESRGYATFYSLDVEELVQNFTENLWVNNLVGRNNIVITDANSDGIPDDKAQIQAIYKQATTIGLFIFVNGNVTQVYTPDSIKEGLHYDKDDDSFDITVMAIGVSGSGSLDNIKVGMDNILKDAEVIEDTGDAEVIVTGTGPLRYEQLTAISNSMFYSIIISIIVCFIIILLVFRRPGLSFIAILPVILISIWLYGSMHYTGYNLNIVTSTIGAMSIGVGVDYSIHVTDRFRKEKATGKNFDDAMHSTIYNSGTALVFSALTTTFGFFVLLFAPMPMFFSFGLFSGLMVLLALLASVIIVPPLIRFVVRNRAGERGKADEKSR